MFDYEAFASQVKEARITRGISRHKLAILSGLSNPTITNIEIGKTNPSFRTIQILSEFLGLGDAKVISVEIPAQLIRDLIRKVSSLEKAIQILHGGTIPNSRVEGPEAYITKTWEDRPSKRRYQKAQMMRVAEWLNADYGNNIHAVGLCNIFPAEIAKEMIASGIKLNHYWGFENTPEIYAGIQTKTGDKFSVAHEDIWNLDKVLKLHHAARVGFFDFDFCGFSALIQGIETGRMIDLLKKFVAPKSSLPSLKGHPYRFAVSTTYSQRKLKRKLDQELADHLRAFFKVDSWESQGYADGSPMKTTLYLCSLRSKREM